MDVATMMLIASSAISVGKTFTNSSGKKKQKEFVIESSNFNALAIKNRFDQYKQNLLNASSSLYQGQIKGYSRAGFNYYSSLNLPAGTIQNDNQNIAKNYHETLNKLTQAYDSEMYQNSLLLENQIANLNNDTRNMIFSEFNQNLDNYIKYENDLFKNDESIKKLLKEGDKTPVSDVVPE